MGSSDEKWPPSPRQAERPKARLAARPSLAVVLGRRRDVTCRDLDLCVFGRSLLAPASAPIRSERRRQVRGRSFEPLARGPWSSSGLSRPSGRMSASERLSYRRSKVLATLVERNRKVAPHAPHHNPDETRRVAEAICAGLRHELPLVGGVRAGNNLVLSVRTQRLLRAEPAASKSGSVEPDREIRTSSHQIPDEIGAEILDHQDDRSLVDAEVKWRDP